MGDMGEYFEAYREMHRERVAKNPERLKYATEQLKANDITYKVCNETTCQINCYFANGTVHTFYAGTGKIKGSNQRGIKNFIALCKKERERK